MTVIFQLFCVEDLKLLGQNGRDELLTLIREELGLPSESDKPASREPSTEPPQSQSPFVLAIDNDTTLKLTGPNRRSIEATPESVPTEIPAMLKRRFERVSQQLDAPMTRDPGKPSAPNLSEDLLPQFTQQYASRTLEPEERKKILQWAMSCEVNYFSFYYPLLRIKKKAYEMFFNCTGQEPKGPDSLYSPFHRDHPLYGDFENLSFEEESAQGSSPSC